MTLSGLIKGIESETIDLDKFMVVILSRNKDGALNFYDLTRVEEDESDLNFVKSDLQEKSSFKFKEFFNKLLAFQDELGDSVLYTSEYKKFDNELTGHLDLPVTGYAISEEENLFALLDFIPTESDEE